MLAHFAAFCYHAHKYWVVQAMMPIIGTIAIGIMVGIKAFNFGFFLLCAVYTLLVVGDAICQQYDEYIRQSKLAESKQNIVYKELADSQRTLNGIAGRNIYRLARSVKHEGWLATSLQAKREMFGFQSMSFKACQEIKAMCKKMNPNAEYYVTIYQRVQKRGKPDRCRMIAYSNANEREPDSYNDFYKIPDEKTLSTTKTFFHSRLFSVGESRSYILQGEEVQKEFVLHQNCHDREQKIQAYIGIPTKVCNREITLLLQVDCDQKEGLGKTREDMQWFADSVLNQYVSLLALIYETDRLDEVIDTYISSANFFGREVTH